MGESMKRRAPLIVLAVVCCAAPAAAEAVPPYQGLSIESPQPEARTVFGEIVHTVGDIDRDGVKDVITTAENTVNGVSGVGRAFVLSGRTGAVLLTLDDPEPQPFAGFGVSITGLGDVNGDGVPDLAVGAAFQSVNGNDSQGKLFVFSGKNGHLLYGVDDPHPQASAYFGALFVTATDDLNGNGVPDFAVAAPGEDVDGVPTSGAAYAFDGRDGSMIRRMPNPRPETYHTTSEAFFAMGLTDPGDVDGDHVDDLVMGFAGTTVSGNVDQGRAYLVSGRTGALLRSFDDPAPQANAYFGSMYSDRGAPGDVNGDRVRDIYIDADGQTVGGIPDAGQAYLFSGKDGRLLRTLASPMPQDHGFFGFIFSSAGDLFHDGTQQLLVGQTGAAHVAGSYALGGAWVFDPRTGVVLADFTRIAPDAGQGIGSPGDANGDHIPDYFLGAPRTSPGNNPRQGRVFQVLSVAGAQPRLSAHVKRRISATTRFTTTGRLVLPSGIAFSACRGRIVVQISQGTRTVARRHVAPRANCTYQQRTSITSTRLQRHRPITITARFLGNYLLQPATARTVALTASRRAPTLGSRLGLNGTAGFTG